MEDEIRIPIELPRDADGFLRRECPNCEQEFKWFVHAEGDPDAEVTDQYFCPLCGEPSGLDTWCTPRQLEYAAAAAGPNIDQALAQALRDAFKGVRGMTFEPNRNFTLGIPTPEPLTEPNDMVIVEPPCHRNEPVKIPEANADQVHCLICGSIFAL